MSAADANSLRASTRRPKRKQFKDFIEEPGVSSVKSPRPKLLKSDEHQEPSLSQKSKASIDDINLSTKVEHQEFSNQGDDKPVDNNTHANLTEVQRDQSSVHEFRSTTCHEQPLQESNIPKNESNGSVKSKDGPTSSDVVQSNESSTTQHGIKPKSTSELRSDDGIETCNEAGSSESKKPSETETSESSARDGSASTSNHAIDKAVSVKLAPKGKVNLPAQISSGKNSDEPLSQSIVSNENTDASKSELNKPLRASSRTTKPTSKYAQEYACSEFDEIVPGLPSTKASPRQIKPKNSNQKVVNKGRTNTKKLLPDKPIRLYICKKSGCGKTIRRCAVKANKLCCEATGYSSRWYHLSPEEHYCNACFEQFYRNKYEGFDEYHDWKRAWMNNSKADSGFKTIANYMSERQLSYWVKCTRCESWRQLCNEIELTRDIIKKYLCSMGNMANTLEEHAEKMDQRMPHIKYACHQKNDPSVDVVFNTSSTWMSSLNYTPFLKYSPAAPFLTSYYPDGVGMSAVDIDETPRTIISQSNHVCRTPEVIRLAERQRASELAKGKNENNAKNDKNSESRLLMSPGGRKGMSQPVKVTDQCSSYFHPFYKPFEQGKALCMRPDVMELDEAQEFPEYVKDQAIYLGLRNLVVALWTLQKKSFLTAKRCFEFVILRGLTRIHLCELLLPRIICFATYKGLINTGALSIPTGGALLPKQFARKDVIVIGAGPAGLGGARQLHNFGMNVTVFEARDRIGGRVHDDWSLNGVCVGRGAQIVNGCINNPMALISEQLGLKMQVLRSRCDLHDCSGKPIPTNSDNRMDFHFNALLDIIAEWRRNQQENCDSSLGEKIMEAHREWIRQTGLTFSELEEQLLQFHIGNLEFACGTRLDKVSAFHWDQNETFAQFSGDHTLVQYGFSTLLEALASELDLRFSCPVVSVNYSKGKSKVEVQLRSGEVHSADCVLITVPLAVLKSNSIKFTPPLPDAKHDAMERIGCGCIEKIGLQFEERFWDDKINGTNYFGYVPSGTDKKGFFTMFYDMPNVTLGKDKVLMSVISGDSVDAAAEMGEEEIKDVAMSVLRKIFHYRKIPDPKKYFVTCWKKDPYAQMAYSYIKTHGSGDDYDKLAQCVDGRLYFGGEATNRHFPQTVTGAYLSGLREAAKIAVYKP